MRRSASLVEMVEGERNSHKGREMKFILSSIKGKISKFGFISLLFLGLGWIEVAFVVFIYLLEESNLNGILSLLLIIPFISLPLIIIYLFEKEGEIKNKYRFYQSELDSLVNIIFKSNMINEIDDSDRKKVLLWANNIDIELPDSPKLLSGYFEHLFIGVFLGFPIGSLLYIIGKFVLKKIVCI